jgi:20S proteasome alpha/beta subunit
MILIIKHKILHDSVVLDIMGRMEEFRLEVRILLAGVDSEARIYYICDPGTYSSYDEIGFFCPGMGKEQAESTFVWYDFSPEQKLSEVLFIAFEAKKRAKAAGSVGKMTDGWIIDKGGCHAIARETIDELEKIYEKRQEIFRREKLGKEIEELKIIKKEVDY